MGVLPLERRRHEAQARSQEGAREIAGGIGLDGHEEVAFEPVGRGLPAVRPAVVILADSAHLVGEELGAPRPAVAAGGLLRVPVVASVGGAEVVSLPDIEYGALRTVRGRVMTAHVLQRATLVTGGLAVVAPGMLMPWRTLLPACVSRACGGSVVLER